MSSDNPRVPAASTTPAPLLVPPSSHYENFPVASWLCPRALRPPIAAIYWFARTADDLADEGEAPAHERLADLTDYRADLLCVADGLAPSARWAAVFAPLAREMQQWRIPLQPLTDLLDAFEQDVHKTHSSAGYADRAELLDYCRRSANPVGRLLLHLWGIADARSLAQSDAICSALQLINFWQDLSLDLPRSRYYVPAADAALHGVTPGMLAQGQDRPAMRALVAHEVAWARALMLEGAPLVHRVPGRAGWELRAVVQGGLRVLDRIEAIGFDTLRQRPVLGRADVARVAWRVLRM